MISQDLGKDTKGEIRRIGKLVGSRQRHNMGGRAREEMYFRGSGLPLSPKDEQFAKGYDPRTDFPFYQIPWDGGKGLHCVELGTRSKEGPL